MRSVHLADQSRRGKYTIGFLRSLQFFGALLISLNSYYFAEIGFPVIPLAGVLLFSMGALGEAVTTQRTIRLESVQIAGLSLSSVPLLFSIVQGAASTESNYFFKSIAGYAAGLMLLVVIYTRPSGADWLRKSVIRILAMHIAAFIIQFFSLEIWGVVIDYVKVVTGEESRIFGGSITRCTGLWVEPAMYSTFCFGMMLVHIASNRGKFSLLDGVAMTTIILSRSTTGIALVAGFAVLIAVKRFKGNQRLASVGIFVSACSLTVWLVPENILEAINRVGYLSDDTSASIRFLGLWDQLVQMSPAELIVGLGIGSPVALTTGHNGIYMNLVGFGIFGSLLFWGGVLLFLKSKRPRLTLLLVWGGSFLGAPHQTWAYWWLVLGGIAYFSRLPTGLREDGMRRGFRLL